MFLVEHPRPDFRGGQQRQGEDHRGTGGVTEDGDILDLGPYFFKLLYFV